jgi:hypothetical protein
MMRNGLLARPLGIVIALLLLLSTVTVATAAVGGNLSAEYDANASTDTPGREIVVSGTFEVTGENAVNSRITVQPAQETVIDADTVEVFVEGSRSVDFQRQTQSSGVVYTADEIPSGTTLEVQYVVYSKGTSTSDVTAGTVEFQFESSGATQTEEFSASADLSNSPQARASQLDDRVAELESRLSVDWQLRFFILFGVAIVVLIGTILALRDSDGGPPEGSESPPGGGGGPPN